MNALDAAPRMASRARGLTFAATVLAQLLLLYAPAIAGLPHIGGLSSLAHILSFGAVLYTGVRFGLAARSLVAVLLVHAPISEIVQHWLLPTRTGDWRDAAADVIGIGGGYLLSRQRPR